MGTYITTHAGDSSHRKVILLQITIDTVRYYTNYDIPIVTVGTGAAPSATWTPLPFEVSGITSSQGQLSPTGNLTLPNADSVIGTLFLGLSAMTGLEIKVYEAWLDPTGNTTVSQDEALLIQGTTDSPSIQRNEINISIGPYIPLRGKILPRRKINHACQFDYKSSICGATGTDTVCDKSLAACALPTKIVPIATLATVAAIGSYIYYTTTAAHGLTTNDFFQVYECSDATYNVTLTKPESVATTSIAISRIHAPESVKSVTGKINLSCCGNIARFGGFPILQGVE